MLENIPDLDPRPFDPVNDQDLIKILSQELSVAVNRSLIKAMAQRNDQISRMKREAYLLRAENRELRRHTEGARSREEIRAEAAAEVL